MAQDKDTNCAKNGRVSVFFTSLGIVTEAEQEDEKCVEENSSEEVNPVHWTRPFSIFFRGARIHDYAEGQKVAVGNE